MRRDERFVIGHPGEMGIGRDLRVLAKERPGFVILAERPVLEPVEEQGERLVIALGRDPWRHRRGSLALPPRVAGRLDEEGGQGLLREIGRILPAILRWRLETGCWPDPAFPFKQRRQRGVQGDPVLFRLRRVRLGLQRGEGLRRLWADRRRRGAGAPCRRSSPPLFSRAVPAVSSTGRQRASSRSRISKAVTPTATVTAAVRRP